jgi:hypothetical protein
MRQELSVYHFVRFVYLFYYVNSKKQSNFTMPPLKRFINRMAHHADNTNNQNRRPGPRRLVIHTQDIINITGLSQRSARRIIQNIKRALCKHDHEFVTVREFAAVYGIDEEFIFEHMD